MGLYTAIDTIRSRIANKEERQRVKDAKLLLKYRSIINDRLRSMNTKAQHIFFANGKLSVLEQIVEELKAEGYDARTHYSFMTYPEGIEVYIKVPEIPTQSQEESRGGKE